MKEQQVSRTALLMAYVRGYHTMHGVPKIFNDYLAYSLLKEEDRAFFDQQLSPPVQFIESIDPASAATCHDQASCLAWAMRSLPSTSHTISRSRYTEDALKEAVRHGVQQYVILGAGMDTFAFRCPEMLEQQLQVFEVDHPATQAFKRCRLAELSWELPVQLHFVPVDFTKENLSAALTRSSYDPKALSFFSWLGVTYYLSREAVFATLRAFADVAPAGSTVIFDYIDSDAFVPGRVAERLQVAIEKARQWGEPMTTGFDPSMLTSDLVNLGLRLHEDLSPSDIQGRYFQGRTDGYYACEHVHFARAVVA
ncbi:class I SAM-dependent methyltransferase [Desulfoscipio gibsoniae]|uniref:S-adenosyl-L-methionine-dependent methyltransferase n=1 Tax=Desulfoscipio gibsoniae DSM 7213 TaxID=767817 RepID=R4KB67_9FIRM|nr:class I SAM-dependent methyltransferase [Desulfoscipio gibsoniae]AGK99818.1 methyltransferase, putative, TIGR00027 family [Desulfoscipio gibsoniae DSM 7213]